MTIDYHRTPMIQFRPDAELYAAIEAHQRPGESINQTAKRLVQEAITIERGNPARPAHPPRAEPARLAQPPRAEPIPSGHGCDTARADPG